MHRFYLPSPGILNGVITITDNRIVHQVGKVLRMWKEDRFRIFDENGEELIVEILEINKRRIIQNAKIVTAIEPAIRILFSI